jgi:FdhD protein
VLSVRGSKATLAADSIVREAHLSVVSEGTLLAALGCSPVDLEDLVTGFLYGQGLIDSADDLAGLDIDEDRDAAPGAGYIARVSLSDPARVAAAVNRLAAVRFVASGCGAAPLAAPGGAAGGPSASQGATGRGQAAESAPGRGQPPTWPEDRVMLDARTLYELSRELQHCSALFQATGGVHAAALSGPLPGEARLLVVREDIGRHNAVDKVAGYCLRHAISLSDKALLVTGRLSVEMVAKAGRAGCRLLVSPSAPTSLAVDLADQEDITLVGFARAERANVYTHWWRVRL